MGKQLFFLISLIGVLCVAGNVSAQLLAYYKFDETAGWTVTDASGNGNDATIEGDNDPNWVLGRFDGALGLNDNRIVLPAENLAMTSSVGTVAFWMQMPDDGPRGGINTIWWGGDNDTGGGFGPENEMHIHVESAVDDIWMGGEMAFHIQGDPCNVHIFSDPEKGDVAGSVPVNPILMGDGQWHHVACTWGNEDGNVKLYIDGDLIDEIAYAYTDEQYPLTNMYIGAMADWVAGAGGRPYIGLLDEFKIYGNALTAKDIELLALSLTAALPDPRHQQKEVVLDAGLSWLPGDRSVKRDVYFGTNFSDVNAATVDAPLGVLAAPDYEDVTYNPGQLAYNQTYYWRVDEVNGAPDYSINRGVVWEFTTRNFNLVDDFEAYDDVNDRIFDRWLDGWSNTSNGSVIGYVFGDAGPGEGEHYVETGKTHKGKKSGPMSYDNTGMKYSEVSLAESWNLVSDGIERLSLYFLGNMPYVGGFVENPAGTYTVTASGADIWGASDGFHFVYKEINGAAKIRARVDSIEDLGEDGWCKAGVMIRNSLDPGSRYVGVLLTPGNGVRDQYRINDDGDTEREFDANMVAPYWVRAELTTGGLVRAYMSPDGSDWHRFTVLQISRPEMPLYVGLAVSAHIGNLSAHTTSEIATEGVFSNVTIEGTGSDGPWLNQDVGINSNAPQPVYVALNGVPVYYTDPNTGEVDNTATQKYQEWVPFEVDLQSFIDQGVDVSHVTDLAVGVGDKTDPANNEGTGLIYLDDIRWYRP